MMNNNLDELLQKKKNISVVFDKNTEEFTQEFFSNINTRKAPHFQLLKYAASILIVGVLLLICTLTTQTKNCEFDKVTKATQLFDNHTAVMFVGDELYTGERTPAPDRVELTININNQRLLLLCSKAETIVFDNPNLSGSIITSPCNDNTFIADINLEIDGNLVQAIVPFNKSEQS